MIRATNARVSEAPAAPSDGATRTERVHIVVTGHVDHGKSSVVGCLLTETGSLPQGKLEAVHEACRRRGKPFEPAFLLDALKDEREQGITIDAARVFFSTERRHYVILDTPGHVEFLKNMVTGASSADAALLVIDASEGVRDNTRRHGWMLSMLGVKQVAVLVNKMDRVNYDQGVFDQIVAEYRAFLSRSGLTPAWFIPVSARSGDNISRTSGACAWYGGPTVLEALDAFEARPSSTAAALRLPVQGVYKFTGGGDDRRIVAGTVESGRLSVGDEVVFYPSGKRTRVRTLEAFNRAASPTVCAEQAVGFTLSDQIYVERGEVATLAAQPRPHVGRRLRVNLFWLGRAPLEIAKPYVFRLGTGRTRCRVERIHRTLDAADLTQAVDGTSVRRHEIAECTLALESPLAFDTIDRSAATSRFVIVDSWEISGGGVVLEPLADRPAVEQLRPAVVWLTGLSGAGKTTIARELCRRLNISGARVEFLDGDDIRQAFPNTGFGREDRDAHVRRVGFLASRLEHHGVISVCALISPYASSRQHVREMCERFIEVYVATPLAECERRDVKGLYERARRGEIPGFTGVDDPYETPETPEVRLDTREMTVSDAVETLIRAIRTVESGARSDQRVAVG